MLASDELSGHLSGSVISVAGGMEGRLIPGSERAARLMSSALVWLAYGVGMDQREENNHGRRIEHVAAWHSSTAV